MIYSKFIQASNGVMIEVAIAPQLRSREAQLSLTIIKPKKRKKKEKRIKNFNNSQGAST